jgi:hypothetical protein
MLSDNGQEQHLPIPERGLWEGSSAFRVHVQHNKHIRVFPAKVPTLGLQ